jgi:CheY-like chemotaxis protein
VEDNPNDVLLFRKALRRASIFSPVIRVENGAEAIAYLEAEGKYADRKLFPFPDLLITDLHMPLLDGFDLIKWVRAHPAMVTLPIVVFSSSNREEDVTRACMLGANACLQKMRELDSFVSKLQAIYGVWQPSDPSASQVPAHKIPDVSQAPRPSSEL